MQDMEIQKEDIRDHATQYYDSNDRSVGKDREEIVSWKFYFFNCLINLVKVIKYMTNAKPRALT